MKVNLRKFHLQEAENVYSRIFGNRQHSEELLSLILLKTFWRKFDYYDRIQVA